MIVRPYLLCAWQVLRISSHFRLVETVQGPPASSGRLQSQSAMRLLDHLLAEVMAKLLFAPEPQPLGKNQSTQRHKASLPMDHRPRRYGRFWLALRLPQDRNSDHILRSLIARPARRAAAAVRNRQHVPNWSWTAIFPLESRTNLTFGRNLQANKNCECPGQDDSLRFLTLTYDLFRSRFWK